MHWLRENEFGPRPLVVVEDHVYHISELLRTIHDRSPQTLESLTIVCLDKRGSDTDQAVSDWVAQYPTVQIAVRLTGSSTTVVEASRVLPLEETTFSNQSEYCKTLATFIRKQGLLLQDIELETLKFIPRERWWESTMLASTIRGIVGEHGPKCAFFSNKRGYEATFGAELLAAGHDPRDVLNKLELNRIVVPFLEKHLADNFLMTLRWSETQSGEQTIRHCLISDCELDELSEKLDIVLWPSSNDSVRISGLALEKSKADSLMLPSEGNEAQTWRSLIEARFEGNSGVEVQEIGNRVAPPGALRPESTNAAARHIHSIRKRMIESQSIVTVQGQYRLSDLLSVGVVTKT